MQLSLPLINQRFTSQRLSQLKPLKQKLRALLTIQTIVKRAEAKQQHKPCLG